MSPTRRAIKAFEDFKGEKPAKLRRSRLPDQDVTGWEMGPMVGVAYEAVRDGVRQQYFHEFKPSARPRLVAQDDGRKLYIEGGRYRVTDRGIEDMPNLFVVNPSARSAASKRKGTTMARVRRKLRSSSVNIFAANPRRRRRRAARSGSARRLFARNPARRRRRSTARSAVRRVYARNPSRRRRTRSVRRYRRNPSGMGGVGKLTSLLMPAVFIGAGAVVTEIATGYLPIPMAWKTGPMRYVVKAGVGIGLGLVVAKVFKQKKLGYYFAAGAVAIAAHDLIKTWLVTSVPSVRGLSQYGRAIPLQRFGYVNPASVARFGQYVAPLRSQFGGDAPIPSARQPGGEMNFAA